MDNKKKITIAVVSVAIVIAIAIIVFLLTKNTITLHTISFDTNGGVEVASQEVEDGDKATKPNNPTKEGYEFLGWYLGDEEYDFSKPVEENITLEAKWKVVIADDETDINEEENNEEDEKDNEEEKEDDEEKTTKVTKYTVKFDSNGGSSVDKQTVEKNKKAKEPSAPTKEGYTFKGWYLGNTKFKFSTKITKNITLVAKWKKVEEITEPETPDTPVVPETPVTPEVTKYTVTFNTDGGSSVAAQTIEEGKTATKPSNPTKDGYTFSGWYYNGTLYNFNTQVTGNVTLVAKWEKNAVITHKIESEPNSYVNQVRIFVLKDDVKVAGIVDITLANGKVVTDVSIPKTGYLTNGYNIKDVTNERVK